MDEVQRQALCRISTGTITMVLLKEGLRNIWIRGSGMLDPTQPRVAGSAFTLRFVPGREDLATPQSLASSKSTRFAVEEMPAGCMAVVSCCGVTNAGVFGDILCARMAKRSVAGLVTDGSLRDLQGLRRTGLPIWCSGIAAPPSVSQLTFVDWQQPIGCGGVAILPGDIIVADQDGAVVIPPPLINKVIEAGQEMEEMEEWTLQRVLDGRKLPGLYPPSDETMMEFKRR